MARVKFSPINTFTMSQDGRETRTSTLSSIYDAFEDEKNREMVSPVAPSHESYDSDDSVERFDEDSFPSLSSRAIKSSAKPPKVVRHTDSVASESKISKNYKEYICKAISAGEKCPYGKRCKFAHNAKELKTKNCSHGDNCHRIKNKKGIVCNVDSKNPCIFIHPCESVASFLDRKGIKGLPLEDHTDFEEYKYTRMCVSYMSEIKCLKGKDCTYAHEIDELRVATCNFGDKCNNIYKDGKVYENYDSKVCQFLHPDESLNNFYERVLKDNIKKAKEMRKKAKKADVKDSDAETPYSSDDASTISAVESAAEESDDDSSEEDVLPEVEETESVSDESVSDESVENRLFSPTTWSVSPSEDLENITITVTVPNNKVGLLCEAIFNSGIKNIRIGK
jgi:Putative zinc finger protein